jgi:hypothetical protein
MNATFKLKKLKTGFKNSQFFFSDSETVCMGAKFPELGWRDSKERNLDLEADGISGCRNIFHLVLRSICRLVGKLYF